MKGRERHPIKKRTAYALALAGISAALALLFVWLGVVTRYVTIAFFAAAGLAVNVPLSKKYYASSVFALLVSAGLSFLVGDVAAVAGYALYFGPMALISAIMWEKKVKWYIAYPVKIVWINGALAALYYGLQGIEVLAPDLAAALPYWAIAIIGTVALLLIDLLMNYAYANLKTVAAKVIRDKDADEVSEEELRRAEELDSDPFERDGRNGADGSSEDCPAGNAEEKEEGSGDGKGAGKSASEGAPAGSGDGVEDSLRDGEKARGAHSEEERK